MRQFLLFCMAVLLPVLQLQSWATPPSRHSEFEVPSLLAGRVKFWIDIFARYGEDTAVVHHRHYPQAVFTTIDFSAERRLLSPALYERARKNKEERIINQVKSALISFSVGRSPSGEFETKVFEAMRKVPGGPDRFKEASLGDIVRTQRGIRERYEKAVIRSTRYLPHIERIFVREFGLPIELTRLPYVESSFDFQAYSSVGAAGIWQFMPGTARHFGMKITSALDERRDPITASRSAARYLALAYRSLGKWPLALTSYNHGVTGVKRKVAALGTSDMAMMIERPRERLFGFASANFWPEFLAALEIEDHVATYFPNIRRESVLDAAEMKLPRTLTITQVTKGLSISADELRGYNYGLSDKVFMGSYSIPAGYTLRVPRRLGVALPRLASLPAAKNNPSSTSVVHGGTTYRVASGDTINSIAQKHSILASSLRAANKLKTDHLRIGQTLKIPNKGVINNPGTKSSYVNSKKIIPSKGKGGVHKARKGESIWSIGKKYNRTSAQILKSNPALKKGLKEGDLVVISPK